MKPVYLDHAAATPVFPEILEAVKEVFALPGNPSALHQYGRRYRALIDEARITLATHLEVEPGEMLFTSGATEALHLGIIGAFLGIPEKKRHYRITMLPILHSAAKEAISFLQNLFPSLEVIPLPVDAWGSLKMEEVLEAHLQSDLVVIELVNSEIGTWQPASRLGRKIQKFREKASTHYPLFLVDTAAAMPSLHWTLPQIKADMAILSGEKFGAFSGVGALVKKESVKLSPLQGGSQEFGLRGGTENTLGIWSMGEALKVLVPKKSSFRAQYERFNAALKDFFTKEFGVAAKILTPEKSSPHILSVAFPEMIFTNALLLAKLDLAGIFLSAGSACSSGSPEGSKVLKTLKYPPEITQKTIRFSFGYTNTPEDIEKVKSVFLKLKKEKIFSSCV